MRITVTGAGGLLGTDVAAVLAAAGHQVTALRHAELDILDSAAVADGLTTAELVVNCAGWAAVDRAEGQEREAFALNATAPAHLARVCAAQGSRLVQISSDYVFGGDASAPYAEDAPLAPRSAYGRTKAAGEQAVRAVGGAHWLLRTAWLYGAHGPNFARTIARLAAERPSVTVVDDQVGQPTWTADVGHLLARLIAAQAPTGTYHATASGQASWFDFAQAVVGAAGLDPACVRAIDSAGYAARGGVAGAGVAGAIAERPAWSVLGHTALVRCGVAPIGPWHERWDLAAPEVLGLG